TLAGTSVGFLGVSVADDSPANRTRIAIPPSTGFRMLCIILTNFSLSPARGIFHDCVTWGRVFIQSRVDAIPSSFNLLSFRAKRGIQGSVSAGKNLAPSFALHDK